MSLIRKTPDAWVIELDRREPGKSHAGVWLFQNGQPVPEHLSAYRCAAWKTRRQAAAARRTILEQWPRARVVPVAMFWMGRPDFARRPGAPPLAAPAPRA